MKDISLYFHIPFCRRRCGYCDFNTFAGMQTYIPRYVNALCTEVDAVLSMSPEPFNAQTIFFGGGTPSLLTSGDFEKILQVVNRRAAIPCEAEITLEANPETVTDQSIRELREIGFNRISFGMQSASARDLKMLDRQHTNESMLKAVAWSRQAGFSNINLDLIFGIPRQSLSSWQNTLRLALDLNVEHFSVYSLILEDGTRLKKWVDRGLVEEPDEDLAADMYELTMTIMEREGYSQYEISNWAISPEKTCRHNLQYWRYLPYLGFGAGAHGFVGTTRTVNTGLITGYIDRIDQGIVSDFPAGPACEHSMRLTGWEQVQEHMMVSMRMTDEGVSIKDFQDRYRIDITVLFAEQINRLLKQGLIEYHDQGKGLRLTRKGRLFGNRVFAEFIGNTLPQGYEHLNN